jgi:multidrug transporter EmrE-like cation transporter
MNVVLLTLLQGVGAVALSVVAFSVALTWPSLTASIEGMRTERSRLLTYAGLGVALLIAAAPIYLAPGLLLRDELGFSLAIPLVATWVIASAALVVRGFLLKGVARVISYSYAIVAGTGLVAGIVSGLYAQHQLADTVTPTGAFLLALAAVTGIVLWSNAESPEMRRA